MKIVKTKMIKSNFDDNTNYAPIIIPTLCRYEHFKRCMESLSQCTLADRTDVYIGLDYPAKESHWDGYKKIKRYLNETTFNFSKLIIFERERNYGPSGNFHGLIKHVFQNYDRIIISEDDNLFSRNFLVYINKGLKKFANDKSVFSINGYKHPHKLKFKENTYLRQNVDFSAWGYGIWKDRWENIPSPDYFRKNFNLRRFFKMEKEIGANRAFQFWGWSKQIPLDWWDSSFGVYAYLEKKYMITPVKTSLVRNMGWDGSGVNCPANVQTYLTQEISQEKTFDYIGTGFEYFEENRNIYRNNSFARVSFIQACKKNVKIIIQYIFKIAKQKI